MNQFIKEFLAENPDSFHNWDSGNAMDVGHGMPDGTPRKVKLAKMKSLIKQGLVDGCACGCRGDFEITDKGMERVNTPLPR